MVLQVWLYRKLNMSLSVVCVYTQVLYVFHLRTLNTLCHLMSVDLDANLTSQAFSQAFHSSSDMLSNLKLNYDHWSAVEAAL